MKNKIIKYIIAGFLIIFLFQLHLIVRMQKTKIKELEYEKRVFERQIELNKQDLLKMTEEVENARKVRNKSKTVKNDGHLDAIVDNDFAKFLQNNHSM